MWILVLVLICVCSFWLFCEFRLYLLSSWLVLMVWCRIRLICLESSCCSWFGYFLWGRFISLVRNLFVFEWFCFRDWNFFVNGLCWVKVVSQGDLIIGVQLLQVWLWCSRVLKVQVFFLGVMVLLVCLVKVIVWLIWFQVFQVMEVVGRFWVCCQWVKVFSQLLVVVQVF